jgi:hypothetical protein
LCRCRKYRRAHGGGSTGRVSKYSNYLWQFIDFPLFFDIIKKYYSEQNQPHQAYFRNTYEEQPGDANL